MNRIDNTLTRVSQKPRETLSDDRANFLRAEIDRLCAKAAQGTATQEEADLCSEYSHELAELEA